MDKIKTIIMNIIIIMNVYSDQQTVGLESLCGSFNGGYDTEDRIERYYWFIENEAAITQKVIARAESIWVYIGILGMPGVPHFPLEWVGEATTRNCVVYYKYAMFGGDDELVYSQACPYLQGYTGTQEQTGWTHVVNLRYLNQLPGCAGFQPFEIVKTKCYELGSENPLKPLTPGIPQNDGKWVRVIFTFSNGRDSYDSTVQTVLSGGCSGVEIDGQPMRKSNAYDSSFTMDGATIKICSYEDTILVGTCAENGLNTGCGGEVPFSYDNNNDSILNDCFGYGSIEDIDTNLQRPGTNIDIQSDEGTTGSQYASGINHLSSEIRSENALNREISNKQLEEQKKSNNLLRTITGALAGISNSIKNLFSIPDSASKSAKLSEYENGGLIDSTGFPIDIGDSLQTIQGIRSKFIDDTLTDTIDYQVDSAGISEIFQGFNVDFGNTDCDCDPEWFRIEVPHFTEFYIDICPYNIDSWCKYIFKIMAAIVLFVFYRNSIYKTLDELFK